MTDTAAEALLTGILGDDVEPSVRTRLVGEAEGSRSTWRASLAPFREGALESRGRTWTISMRSPELLPPTLENLLLARIDRLAAARAGSPRQPRCHRSTFPVGVLAPLVSGADVAEELRLALPDRDRAASSGATRTSSGEFTHGLLQEVALATLAATARASCTAASRPLTSPESLPSRIDTDPSTIWAERLTIPQPSGSP